MTAATDYTLAELCIVAASKAFANDGEVLATGIGVIPRLAASLAMKTTNTDLMMTDSEAWMLSEPNPLGKRPAGFVPATESWMGFARIFDNVWSGRRHAMLGPTQIDQYGQSNTSALGGTYEKPKTMMLGARVFRGIRSPIPTVSLYRNTIPGCSWRASATLSLPSATTRRACPGDTAWTTLTSGWSSPTCA
ncbi:MAG: hypothetical protein R3E50_02575 [Halioglobus sp.]